MGLNSVIGIDSIYLVIIRIRLGVDNIFLNMVVVLGGLYTFILLGGYSGSVLALSRHILL